MIGIYNLEGYPNIALEKVKAYFLDRCEEYKGELFNDQYETVYVSSLFTWTLKPITRDNWITGGTGYNLSAKLPDYIERMKPKVNFGFTSRGCIWKCDFCCVREKEGQFEVVGDLLDLWDGKAKQVDLLDNNPTANKQHFRNICEQARNHNIRINFNALDYRTLDDDICDLLKNIKHTNLRFAFDDIRFRPQVMAAIDMLKEHGFVDTTWYVLVGFNSTWDEDMIRLHTLRDRGQSAFVQIYNKYDNPDRKKYTNLARWANQHGFFRKMEYEEFLRINKIQERKGE